MPIRGRSSWRGAIRGRGGRGGGGGGGRFKLDNRTSKFILTEPNTSEAEIVAHYQVNDVI
jgi:hypothetical protein